MISERFDKVIIGAGFYGLYSALFCCERGQNVVVLECGAAPFKRAAFMKQVRVHQGYHYPSSISTAMKFAGISPENDIFSRSSSVSGENKLKKFFNFICLS